MSRRPFVLAVLALVALAHAPVVARGDENAVLGLWEYHSVFVPGLAGKLLISRQARTWTASLGGRSVTFHPRNTVVRFSFGGREGEFRGELVHGALSGFWLQPPGDTKDARDPGGSGQPFASPLQLHAGRAGVWSAMVRPLPNSFTLFLKIYRNAKGELVGAIRNPELNSNGGASWYRVSVDWQHVRLSQKSGSNAADIVFDATRLEAPDRLSLFWPDLGKAIELARRAPQEVPDFFPRPPGSAAYVYSPPSDTEDGWTVAPARDAGFDEAALTHLVQGIIDLDPAQPRAPLMHAMLIARHGKLVLEEYFFGYGRETPHDLRSAGKTYASVLLGTARLRGIAIAPETRVTELLAARGPFANPDARKDRITLAHLMTHSAGLACDDNDGASPGNEETMQAQQAQPDWWKYTLDLPMAFEPGRHYAYCSANTNLVGAALTTATKTWLPAWFDRTFARPLDFAPYYWNLMPTQEGYLGGGAWIRPRDFLKLGQVYLDKGVWRGRRIVSADWVVQSTAPRMTISPETTGLSKQDFSNFYFSGPEGYARDAYAWHPGSISANGRLYRDYAATGNGGQLLIVVPELDLTVVFTGGNYGQGGIWGRWSSDIVGGAIIPAIVK